MKTNTRAFKEGYVEEAISRIENEYLAAYLMIDVGMKNGQEKVPDELRNMSLSHYLDELSCEEVWLTDDIYGIENEGDAAKMLAAVRGKNICIHYRTAADRVDQIERLLEKVTQDHIKADRLLLDWKIDDDDYILYLMKRVNPECVYTLRLYQDGNGVILCESKNDTRIRYFKIREPLRETIVSRVSEKVDYIVSHHVEISENEHYFVFPVHCRYGLKWKYNNAEDMSDDYMIYEDCDYGFDEYEMEIACMLLKAPEVRCIWMKLHE